MRPVNPRLCEFMQVVYYPDPILRRRADPIETFDGDLVRLVEDMKATMIQYGGVGLAAPQVGIPRRLLILSEDGTYEQARVLVNPTVRAKGELVTHQEGCLSFPDIYGDIIRPDQAEVEAFDEKGNPVQFEEEGWVARIILHEYDHLEGKMFVERMSPADKVRIKKAMKALKDRYEQDR